MSESPNAAALQSVVATFPLAPRLRHDRAQQQRFGISQELSCPLCSVPVVFAPRARLVDCPSCASPLVRGPDDQTPLAPTGVLRFTIDEKDVSGLARQGLKRFGLRRPTGSSVTSFERVYVPMWRFTTHVVCNWVQEYDHRDAPRPPRQTGEFSDDYDLQVVASTDVNHDLLEMVESIPVANADPFPAARDPQVRVLPINVPLQDAWVKARMQFVSRAMAGSSAQGFSVWPHWSKEEGALVLVPAYLGHEKTAQHSVPVLVDGITGKVYGGIGRAPFRRGPGLPSAIRTLGRYAMWAGFAWATLTWLDIDVLALLDAILGSGRPRLTSYDIFGR